MPSIDEQIKQTLEAKRLREAAPPAGHPDRNADPQGFLRQAIQDAAKKKLSGTVGKKLQFPPDGDIFATLGYLPYQDPEALAAIEELVYPKPKPPPAMKPAANSGVAAAPSKDTIKQALNAAQAGIRDPFADLLDSAKRRLPGNATPVDPNSIK